MNNNPTNNPPVYHKATLVLLFVGTLVLFLIYGKPLLVPLLLAAFIAMLLMPLSNRMQRWRFPKILAVFISILVLTVVLGGVILFFIQQLSHFGQDVAIFEKRIEEIFERFNETIEKLSGVEPEHQLDNVKNATIQFLRQNVSTFGRQLAGAASGLTYFVLMPVFIFLFMLYSDFLENFMIKAVGGDKNKLKGQKMSALLKRVQKVSSGYIGGMLIVIVILAVCNSVALLALDLENAILFAVFAAILNIIPFLGPLLGSLLPILYAFFTKDPLWYPIAIFAYFYIIQLIESNFLTPKIVGRQVSLNPMVTIIALLAGNLVWGVSGMILFIPIMAILKEIFEEHEELRAFAFLLSDPSRKPNEVKNVNELKDQIQEKITKLKDKLEG